MAEIVFFYFEYALDNDKTDNSCEPGNKYKYTKFKNTNTQNGPLDIKLLPLIPGVDQRAGQLHPCLRDEDM